MEMAKAIQGKKGLEGAVNGWQISGITSVQSGVNLTANSNGGAGDFNVGGGAGALKTTAGDTGSAQSINGTDQIPLQPILTCDPRNSLGPNQFLNGSCFAVPTVAGKNGPIVLPEFFGPWYWTSDLSLFKNFQMGESKKFQFRFSAYNFMNHPLWTFSGSGPGSNSLYLANTKGFGITPIKQGNRIIQLALKFYF